MEGQQSGLVRVGTCLFNRGKRTDPEYEGFTLIVVLTKSASKWGVLGPYELRNEKEQIFENIWQSSKAYLSVPYTRSNYAAASPIVAWEYPAELHGEMVDGEFVPNHNYFIWRDKLRNNRVAVRAPVGWKHRHNCIGAYKQGEWDRLLNYVEARKEIYLPEYCRLVRQQPLFQQLQERLASGENLLIAEQDGPIESSMPYYKERYAVPDDWIQDRTILATEENLRILLNDTRHPWGHGFCLASALQNIDDKLVMQ